MRLQRKIVVEQVFCILFFAHPSDKLLVPGLVCVTVKTIFKFPNDVSDFFVNHLFEVQILIVFACSCHHRGGLAKLNRKPTVKIQNVFRCLNRWRCFFMLDVRHIHISHSNWLMPRIRVHCVDFECQKFWVFLLDIWQFYGLGSQLTWGLVHLNFDIFAFRR